MSIPSMVLKTLRLAVPLYLSTLLLGLIPTVVAMLGLVPLAGDRPWRAELLGPGSLNVFAELVMSAVYARQASPVALLFVAVLLVLPLALLAQVAAYSYLAGGILESLHGRIGPRLTFRAACGRWFWPFLRLSLLGGVLAILVGVLGAVLARLGWMVIGPDISALIQYALQAIVLGWLELARASMVMESDRSVGRALRRAGRAAIRPLVLLVWLVIALPGAALLVVSVLPPSVADAYSVVALVQALAFGQIVAFIGAWTKVVRLAVATRIAVTLVPSAASTASAPAVRTG
jgi:hypothetical protein